ncbi:hypothetical protein LguiA_004920 [Lonicera macranthoides]
MIQDQDLSSSFSATTEHYSSSSPSPSPFSMAVDWRKLAIRSIRLGSVLILRWVNPI